MSGKEKLIAKAVGRVPSQLRRERGYLFILCYLIAFYGKREYQP
jgi:hypothetical protein